MTEYKVTLSGEYIFKTIVSAESEEQALSLAKQDFEKDKEEGYINTEIYSPEYFDID